MKKVLVFIIGICCTMWVHAQGGWSSGGAAMPCAQMASTSSALVSMQAHERVALSCHTSYSSDYTSVQDDMSPARAGGPRRVGPNKPNEPGAPIGDGLWILLLCAALYAAKRFRLYTRFW